MKNSIIRIFLFFILIFSVPNAYAALYVVGSVFETPLGNGNTLVGCNPSQAYCGVLYASGGHLYGTTSTGHTYDFGPLNIKENGEQEDENDGAAALIDGGLEGTEITEP